MDYLPDSLRTVWWMRWSKMAAPHIFGGENYKIHRIATAAPPAILTKIFVIRAFYCVKWATPHIFGGENYKIHRIATAAPPAILTKIFVIRAFYCVKWLLTHIFGGINLKNTFRKRACGRCSSVLFLVFYMIFLIPSHILLATRGLFIV